MNATITVPHDERILTLFEPEDKDIGRAHYTLRAAQDSLIFEITAQDAVAMRATLNVITKLLTIWEKTANL